MKKYLFFAFCIALFFTNNVNAQIITTFAGNDTAAYGGDGGPATHAAISGPYGVAIDVAGNIYIADQYNNRVRKVSTSGIISTIAGDGGAYYLGDGGAATAASLNQPAGVAVDATGNVYIADASNHCIRKVNTSGIISTYAGNGLAPGYSGDGGSATSDTANMNYPFGLAIDAAGNLYVAELTNCVIRKISPTGIISTFAGTGIGGFSGDSGPATSAKFNQPIHIALDGSGNMYVADFSNNRIRKINSSGIVNTVAGSSLTAGFSGDGGQATMAKLNSPSGIAINSNGTLFITENGNQRIRNVYPTGVIYTLAGNGDTDYYGIGVIAHYAELDYPYGGCVDASGNFYFADFDNNVIRKITPFINHKPAFTGGHIQTLNVCVSSDSNAINFIMAISDTDTTQTENWTIVLNPHHGTLTTATATSTGSIIHPSGLFYNHTAGSSVPDTFKIKVSDGIGFDTTTVYVNVQSPLTAATITGIDSICTGATLTTSAAGGTWGSSNTSIATVSDSGLVHYVARGVDTILYTRTNSCGTVIAIKKIFIRSHDTCALNESPVVSNPARGINIYPNPNYGSFTMNLASSTDEPAVVVITNIMGEKIKEFTTFTNMETDLKLYAPPGVYLLTATTQQYRYSAKITVQE